MTVKSEVVFNGLYSCQLLAAFKSWDSQLFDQVLIPNFSLMLMAKVTLTTSGPIEVYCMHGSQLSWTSDASSMSVVPVSP